MAMEKGIPECLVLVFTPGVSLRTWRETGMLTREWALYDSLLAHYQRVVLVTFGGASDRAELEGVIRPEHRDRVGVVSNAQGLDDEAYVRALPAMVDREVGGAKTVLVKTNQMLAGRAALAITAQLRASGRVVALVARGGYLWSRFVAQEHGTDSPAHRAAAACEGELCTGADLVVGTTEDMVEDLAWRHHLRRDRVMIVPNYVQTWDEEDGGPAERQPGLLLYAGQLVARKRVNLLIEAAAMVAQEQPGRVTLEIVGDGPERRRLTELAMELGAPVVFRGRMAHEQLRKRMRECCLYVQVSELEGHPKTVIEAMAEGTPVVVSDSPGLGGVVEHGMDGVRIAADAKTLAHTIVSLLDDEEWREVLGAAAARRIRMLFGLPVVLEQELRAHRTALAYARAAGPGGLRESA